MKVLGKASTPARGIERCRKIAIATSLRRRGKPREAGAAAKQTATMRADGTLDRLIANLARRNHGRSLSQEHRKAISESNRRRVVGIETREKHRQSARRQWKEGKVSHLVGTARRHFRSDLKCTFRSSWEANVARIFNAVGLVWDYEPVRYSLPSGKSYAPDFRLENGVLIEVKGYLRLEAAARMEEFRATYPKERLRIIGSEVYANLQKRWGYLQGWES